MSPGPGWGRVGRFVVSDSGGPAPRHLLGHLFPPHGRRERWLRAAARRSRAAARWAVTAAGEADREAGEALERALAGVAAEPWEAWIVARPHGEDRRGRLTAFLFPPGGAVPDRVVKLRRPDGDGRDLAAEAGTLEALGRALPEALRSTLPVVLRHAPPPEGGGWEVLVLSCLPGRSGYVELQGALAPGRLVEGHFQAAGAWLARFHEATLVREAPWTPPPWAELAPTPGEPRPEWHRRIAAEVAEAPWPRVTGHGDFWVRNLLMAGQGPGGEVSGVVDWEHSRAAAPPFEDLFHFAWSYALAYPWGGRRRSPAEAFDRAFLRQTVLSRAVRRFLAGYARETGMDAGGLGDLFRVYLLQRGRGAEREERGTWTMLYRKLERADRSAFSG